MQDRSLHEHFTTLIVVNWWYELKITMTIFAMEKYAVEPFSERKWKKNDEKDKNYIFVKKAWVHYTKITI